MVVWVIVVGTFFGNLGPYTADQTVVQRYLTTQDEKQAAKSIWVNGLLALPTGLLFFGLGTALYVFFKTHPELLAPGRNDEILPWFIMQQVPTGLAGLVIAAIFAAAMSSLDSSMNSIASVAVDDFYRRGRNDISEHTALSFARWVTVAVGGFGTMAAILIAQIGAKSIFDLFVEMGGLLMGALAGLFILGIFTRRTHANGALVGVFFGTLAPALLKMFTAVNFYLFGAAGILTCVVTGYLASLVLPGKSKDLEGLTIHSLFRSRKSGASENPGKPIPASAATE